MKIWKFILLILWLILLIFPVILGINMNNDEYTFSGLVFNPIDGYSYFAKMQQGVAGNWAFQLPYSPYENEKILIFTLYLFLGHISRMTGLSLVFIYHFFRIIFAISFFFIFTRLLDSLFENEDGFYKGAMISILFGGGLGWIYFISGDLPADFWMAEAYGFLSAFSNLHFTLSLLIMSILLIFIVKKLYAIHIRILLFLFGLILGNISPFAAVIMGFVFFVNLFLHQKNLKNNLINLFLFGIPVLITGIYQLITISSDPYLSIWNSQNLTPSPSIINFIFAFSPCLVGIIVLSILSRKKKIEIKKPLYLFIYWIIFAFVMAYLPINLQRRFLVGIYIPIVIVYWYFLKTYSEKYPIRKIKFWILLVIILSLPSNLILLIGSTQAIENYDPIFYQDNSFIKATEWMKTNIEDQSVILTDEDLGLKLPANGFFQVVYGHPFESINAQETKNLVEEFWNGNMTQDEVDTFIEQENVEYILCKSAGNSNTCPEYTELFNKIYDLDGMSIFRVIN